jgi:hypothetical protein
LQGLLEKQEDKLEKVEKTAWILIGVALVIALICSQLFGVIGVMIGEGFLIIGLLVFAIVIRATNHVIPSTPSSHPPNGGA